MPSHRSGFSFGQIDPSFPADPKFRKLARMLSVDDYLQAVGTWAVILAAAYRAGTNVVECEEEAGTAKSLEALRACGLLSEQGIPDRAWEKWRPRPRRKYPSDTRTPRSTADSTESTEDRPDQTRPDQTILERAASSISLTAEQKKQWSTFTAKEWEPFVIAWLDRGFRWPPFGSSEDDDTSQRGVLWSIARDRSEDLGQWVREAPRTGTVRDVIVYILNRWHSVREAAGVNGDPVILAPSRREAPELLRSILERST